MPCHIKKNYDPRQIHLESKFNSEKYDMWLTHPACGFNGHIKGYNLSICGSNCKIIYDDSD